MIKLSNVPNLSAEVTKSFLHGEVPEIDTSLDEVALVGSLEHVADTIEKRDDYETIVSVTNLSREELESSLMATMMSIFTSNTDLDAKTELQNLSNAEFSTEGRLSDFGDYLLEMLKKFIDRLVGFFTDGKDKGAKAKVKLDTATEKVAKGKLEDGEVKIQLQSYFTDGTLDQYRRIYDLAKRCNEYLLSDMRKVMNALEVKQVDILKRIEKDFEFKNVSGLLDESAKLINDLKLGLIAVIEGTDGSGKVNLEDGAIHTVDLGINLKLKFELGDVAGFPKLTFTDDYIKSALEFKMYEERGDVTEVEISPLTDKEAISWQRELSGGIKTYDNVLSSYGAELRNYEGMFKYNRKNLFEKVDPKDKNTAKRVVKYSEQLVLVAMKIYSSLSTRLNAALIIAMGDNITLIEKSAKHYK